MGQVSDEGSRGRIELARLLAGFRLARGLSQEELADQSGMSVRAIRNLEHGHVGRPHRSSIALLADALALTDAGRDLGPVVDALTLWGIEHALQPPRAGEPVAPIPTMIGTKMWLSRNAMPQRPVTWVWQFAGEGDYTIDFDQAVWTLSRGAGKVADVTVDATPEAWARLLTTPRGSRRLSEKSIRLAGTQDSIDLFAQSFILELGRRRPARPAGTLHRAT